MLLTKRDRDLLKLLERMEVLTTRQIHRTFFVDVAHTTVMRRLRILESEKFIRRIEGLPQGVLAWNLAKRSVHTLGLEKAYAAQNKNTLEHDTLVAEVRLHLEACGRGDDWTSEATTKRFAFDPTNLQRSQKLNIPDGIFNFPDKDEYKSVVFELELSRKSLQRYDDILRSYARKRNISVIWYVVKDRALGELLLSKWKDTTKPLSYPVFGYSMLSDVVQNLPNAEFRGDNGVKQLGELFRIDSNFYESEHSRAAAQGVSTPQHARSGEHLKH